MDDRCRICTYWAIMGLEICRYHSVSGVITSSCTGHPCCVLLVASYPRRWQAPRLDESTMQGVSGWSLQCTSVACFVVPRLTWVFRVMEMCTLEMCWWSSTLSQKTVHDALTVSAWLWRKTPCSTSRSDFVLRKKTLLAQRMSWSRTFGLVLSLEGKFFT